MPTQLDRVMNSKNLLLAFAGLVAAAATWAIMGNELFPPERDPAGNPESWTLDEIKRWLRVRNLLPSDNLEYGDLLDRVKTNMRP
ncbi:hypothetical protein LOZ58_001692 [Ophidiomyces ophidiicola]|nr:hypothetical protein LOZ66_001214 [Ophidiomyces ophidiicola]KAI1964999.1 hypothetical protein LOZ58_001692 [Ophidiomyces ophidiicola]